MSKTHLSHRPPGFEGIFRRRGEAETREQQNGL